MLACFSMSMVGTAACLALPSLERKEPGAVRGTNSEPLVSKGGGWSAEVEESVQ